MSLSLDCRMIPLLEQMREIFADQKRQAIQKRLTRKSIPCCVCKKTGMTTNAIAWYGEDRPMCAMHCGMWNADFDRNFRLGAVDADLVELQFAMFLTNRIKNGR